VSAGKESVVGVLIARIVGLVVFLILLGILNILAGAYVQTPIFLQIVAFLNANLGLLILISVIFLVGDLFGALAFPLNLPGPVFGAVGAVFLVMFLLRLFSLVGEITGVETLCLLRDVCASGLRARLHHRALCGSDGEEFGLSPNYSNPSVSSNVFTS